MGDMDDSYLSDLLSYSVERLNREPELLDAEGERAARRKQEVALQEYRAFVGASQCYDTVRSEVADIERGLEAMRGALPELRAGCQAFAARAEEISRARARETGRPSRTRPSSWTSSRCRRCRTRACATATTTRR